MAYTAGHQGMFAAVASNSGLLPTRDQGGPVPGLQLMRTCSRGRELHASHPGRRDGRSGSGGRVRRLYRLGQTWGATGQEQQQPLAGDELLPDARAWTTHAITVAAPAHAVWPWLVQMGWGGPAGTPTAGSTGSCSRLTAPAPTASFRSTSGCARAIASPTAHRRLTAGSPWSGWRRTGCWC